jgi:hypothetical protein
MFGTHQTFRLLALTIGVATLLAVTFATAPVSTAEPVRPESDAGAGPRTLGPGFPLNRGTGGGLGALRSAAEPRPSTPAPTTANVLLLNGSYTALEDAPGAIGTVYSGSNNRGETVGTYFDAARGIHGFRRDRDSFMTIDVPDASATIVFDINDRGQI